MLCMWLARPNHGRAWGSSLVGGTLMVVAARQGSVVVFLYFLVVQCKRELSVFCVLLVGIWLQRGVSSGVPICGVSPPGTEVVFSSTFNELVHNTQRVSDM